MPAQPDLVSLSLQTSKPATELLQLGPEPWQPPRAPRNLQEVKVLYGTRLLCSGHRARFLGGETAALLLRSNRNLAGRFIQKFSRDAKFEGRLATKSAAYHRASRNRGRASMELIRARSC